MSDDEKARMREEFRDGVRAGAAEAGYRGPPIPLVFYGRQAAWARSIGLVEGVDFVEAVKVVDEVDPRHPIERALVRVPPTPRRRPLRRIDR